MKITEETRVKLDELQQEYNDKCLKLIKAEAKANNPYKQGDVIEDHHQVGKVFKFDY
jgi:hypothetical protein